MVKAAYIQSIGGASGDMLLGALIDLGLPLDILKGELSKLNLSGYAITANVDTRQTASAGFRPTDSLPLLPGRVRWASAEMVGRP